MKKIFVIIIAIIIVAAIILGIWFFFSNKTDNVIEEEGPARFFPTTNRESIGETESPNSTNSDDEENPEDPSRAEIPKLRQLSKDPVAGVVAFERTSTSTDTFVNESGSENLSTTTEIVFRYIERGTGHLYETKENSLTKNRLSNTTIPKVYNALFSNDGDRLILRYLDTDNETIRTFNSEIIKEEDPGPDNPEYSLTGKFLPNNITEFSASPDGNSVLYFLTNSPTEQTSVYIADLVDDVVSLVYQTPISQWLSQWIDETKISITTKPHSQVYGYSFILDTEKRELTKVIETEKGLTTLYNPEGTKLIYSVSDIRGLATYVQTIGETAYKLKIKTIPEKCAWDPSDIDIIYCATPDFLPRANYPEDWYQGEASFRDSLWRFNTRTLDLRLVHTFDANKSESFDIIRPQISPDGRYFMFVNKKDLTLWVLDIDPNKTNSFSRP